MPSIEKIIQSSVSMLHRAMNDVVKQILEITPPCAKTEVYFGPEGGLLSDFCLDYSGRGNICVGAPTARLLGLFPGLETVQRSNFERLESVDLKVQLQGCASVAQVVAHELLTVYFLHMHFSEQRNR